MGTRTEPDVMVPEGAAQEGTRPWPTGNMRDVMAARAAMQEVQLRRGVFRQLGVEDPMADMLMMVAEIRSEDPGLPHPAAMDISEDEEVMTEFGENISEDDLTICAALENARAGRAPKALTETGEDISEDDWPIWAVLENARAGRAQGCPRPKGRPRKAAPKAKGRPRVSAKRTPKTKGLPRKNVEEGGEVTGGWDHSAHT